MATISLSAEAPSDGTIHFSIGGFDFDISPGGSVETDDPQEAAAAAAHPWLEVAASVPKPDKVEKPERPQPPVAPVVETTDNVQGKG